MVGCGKPCALGRCVLRQLFFRRQALTDIDKCDRTLSSGCMNMFLLNPAHISPHNTAILRCPLLGDLCAYVQSVSLRRLKTRPRSTKGPKPSAGDFEYQQVCQVFNYEDLLIGNMSVLAAEQMAKKDNMKLVEMAKTPHGIRCFKLMTSQQLTEERSRMRESKNMEKRKEKEFTVRSNISEHDLMTKVNQGRELLGKGCYLKFVFKCGQENAEDSQKLVKKVMASLKDVSVVKHGVRNSREQHLILIPLPKPAQETVHERTDVL